MRLLLLFLLFLFSCSDDTGYDLNNDMAREEGGSDSAFPFSNFNTRLTNNLAVSGTVCAGGEVVEADGRTFGCERDSWLLVVDNVNFCTPEGCTDVEVRPIIAVLQSRSGGDRTEFFDIVPAIPVSNDTENILEDILVKFNDTENAVVIFE